MLRVLLRLEEKVGEVLLMEVSSKGCWSVLVFEVRFSYGLLASLRGSVMQFEGVVEIRLWS